MKTKIILLAIIVHFSVVNAQKETIFYDNFDGTIVNNSSWFFPFWFSQMDGTYFGRTQTRVAQNASLPSIQNGEAAINVETFNPTGFSFYGTDLISRKSFKPGKGIIFTVRAKIKTPIPGGIVGGIYLYDLTVPGMRSWYSIASSKDGTKLVTAVTGGDIWTSTNSGNNWVYQNMTGPQNWQGVASSENGTKLVAIVYGGNIWTSINSGISWTEQMGSGINKWYSVASSDDGTKLVAACLAGYIWTSTDSGVTWVSHTGAGYRNWYSVTSSSDGKKLAAVVYGGRIWTSTDYGVTWFEQTSVPFANWNSITSSLSGTKLAATSFGGGVWTSTDSGITWTNQTNLNSIYLRGVVSSNDGSKLAAIGNYGSYIWTSTDSGITWIKRTGPTLNDWNIIVSSGDGTKLAVVVFGGNIWTSTDSGETWKNQSGLNQSSHDEIDFELLTNGLNKVHTNVYSNEPMGVGRPDSVSITSPITDYHTYSIEWLSSGVVWKVDDNVIRSSTISPAGPMRFNLNMWVPASDWKAAYNGVLQPTSSASSNQIFSMLVDWVRVDSLTDIPTSIIKNKEDGINFYPNPAHDIIYFNTSEKINVSIYGLAGNILLNKKELTNGSLSISSLTPGIYIVQYERNNIIRSSKIIVY